jgi:hypothetical protein
MSKLILTNGTFERIAEYVRQINAEIGMFGYVTMTDDGDFIVDDVFLVEQTVSGSSVDFADSGLEYAIQKAIADDRIDDLKFCCHSHVDMAAFWSSTDEDMIEGMNNGMTPYLVSLVINKSHETKQRVDFFNPAAPLGQFTSQVRYDLDLKVERTTDPDVAEEIRSLVKRQSFPVKHRSSTKYPVNTWLDDPDDLYIPTLNSAGDIVGYSEKEDLHKLSNIDQQLLGMGFSMDEVIELTDPDFAQDVAEAMIEGQTP